MKIVAYAKLGIVTGDGKFKAKVCDFATKKVDFFD